MQDTTAESVGAAKKSSADAERKARMLQEKKLQGERLAGASRACLTKSLNPHDMNLNNAGFFHFAACMERLMHGILSKSIRSLQRPEEARTRARDAITELMANKPYAGGLLHVLTMVEAELGRDWPMETGEALLAGSVPLVHTVKFDICQRHVLPPPLPVDDLDEEVAAKLHTDEISAADNAMLMMIPKWKTLPSAFPPMEILCIMSSRGKRVLLEVGFESYNARGTVMERDCYFNNFRHILSMMLEHPFFR